MKPFIAEVVATAIFVVALYGIRTGADFETAVLAALAALMARAFVGSEIR